MEWTLKYPEILQCIQPTAEVIQILRDNPSCELEARFGKMVENRFKPGVDRNTMDTIIEAMQKSPFVKGEDEWKEETDFYFEHEHKQLRTRVSYDSNTMVITPETTEKKMMCAPVDCLHKIETKYGNMDVRISLKTEHVVNDVAAAVNSTLVRIKQRRRFVTDNNMWAFDFSMTWSGKTKSDAEYSQMNNDAVYEIECELLKNEIYMENKTNEHVAASLLLKMKDLLPNQSSLVMT